MNRRAFISLLGVAAVAPSLPLPPAAHAQQPAMPVIGVLHLGSPEANVSIMAAFRRGLAEVGYVEGRNIAIEFRWRTMTRPGCRNWPPLWSADRVA